MVCRAVLVALAALALVHTALSDACLSNGGSDQCGCAPGIVNCGFLGVTRLPNAIPNAATLLLNDNSIAGISSTFFTPIVFAQVLRLERNTLTTMHAASLAPMADLRELYLSQNLLSQIPSATFFSTLTKLRILRLDSNRISLVPAGSFDTLVLLQELYLNQNKITALPNANIFKNLKSLQILNMDNNQLAVLPLGVFNFTNAMTKLYLQVNAIPLITRGTFSNMTLLRELRMLGNPSSCSMSLVTNAPTCKCYVGYVGDAFCEPIDCGPAITSLDSSSNAHATCVGDTRYLGNNCTATCDAGYLGGSSSYYCNTEGKWIGSITCTPVDCTPTLVLNTPATTNCSGDTRYRGDDCIATCNPGYVGNGEIAGGQSAAYTCNTEGKWTGNLVCRPLDCGTSIVGLPTTAQAVCSGNTTYGGTNCTATCKFGYVGGPATYVCGQDGLWKGSLVCLGVECGRTIATLPANSNARCRGDTSYTGTPCIAKCNPGYVTNNATYTCSAQGIWINSGTPLLCFPKNCGSTVQSLDPNASSACTGDTRYGGNNCTATCNSGYVGSAVYTCSTDGEWAGNLTCTRRECGPVVTNLQISAVSNCTGDTKYLGTPCPVKCAYGWVGNATNYTCLRSGIWSGSINCERPDCGTVIRSAPVGARYNCTGISRYTSPSCLVQCAEDQVGLPVNYTCNINATWEGDVFCQEPSAASNTTAIAAGVAVPLIIIIVIIVLFVVWRSRGANKKRGNSNSRLNKPAHGPSSGFEPEYDVPDDHPLPMMMNPAHASFRKRPMQVTAPPSFAAPSDFEEEPFHSFPGRPLAKR